MDISAIVFAEEEQPQPVTTRETGSLAQVGSVAFARNASQAHWEALDTIYMEFPPRRAEVWPVVQSAPCEPFNRETNNALIARCLKGDFD